MLSRSFADFVDFVNGFRSLAKRRNQDINQALETQNGRTHELCYADRFAAYITLGWRKMALPRTAARWRHASRVLFTVLASAVLGALAFILGVYIHSLGTIPVSQWGVLFRVALLFSIFGALFGTILALDKSADPLFSGLRRLDAPKTRVLICSGLGLLIVVVMRSWSSEPFPFAWVTVGAVVGGILGWFGWRWAQYVDF